MALTRPAWMDDPRNAPPAQLPARAAEPPITDWACATAADGRPYWYSLKSGVTTWVDPAKPAPAPAQTPHPRPQPARTVWREVTTADGRAYYYNESTNQTQWHRPTDMPPSASATPASAPNGASAAAASNPVSSQRQLPAGWAENRTNDGRVYYYHSATRETRWDFPTEHATAKGPNSHVAGRKRPAEALHERPAPSAHESTAARPSAASGAVWKEHTTPDGKTYYYNSVTRVTSWTKPIEASHGVTDSEVNRKRQRVQAPVSDLRQLVSGTNALKDGRKKPVKNNRVVRRPRSSDGKAMTDRQAETYFVKRAEIKAAAAAAKSTEDQEMEAVEPKTSTLHEKEVRFTDMLKEKGVSEGTSWLEAMALCAGDKRYTALDNFGFRKNAWLKFKQKCVKERRRKTIITTRGNSESFLKLMHEVLVKEPDTVSRLDRCSSAAIKKLESDPRFRAVDERARGGLVKSFFGIKARKGEQQRAQKRRECLGRMREQLDAMIDPDLRPMSEKDETLPKKEKSAEAGVKSGNNGNAEATAKQRKRYFTDRTPFRELERFLLSVEGSDVVNNADVETIVRDWRRMVERFSQEKKTREREMRRAKQRERRAAFRSGVEKMLLESRISYSARWKDVAEVIVKEDFAVSQADLDARPSDLFEDALALFQERVDGYREEFKQLLKDGGINIQDSTTLDEVKKDDKLRVFLERTKPAIASSLLVDRQRRESKRRQKELQRATSDFEALLQRSNLRVGMPFEAAMELLKESQSFKQLHKLSGIEHVKKIFGSFMGWLRSKQEPRLKRKLDAPPGIQYNHGAGLPRGKRARTSEMPQSADRFRAPPMPQRAQEEDGWTAALSAKPMTQQEKLAEKERRKREILDGIGNGVAVNAKTSSRASKRVSQGKVSPQD